MERGIIMQMYILVSLMTRELIYNSRG